MSSNNQSGKQDGFFYPNEQQVTYSAIGNANRANANNSGFVGNSQNPGVTNRSDQQGHFGYVTTTTTTAQQPAVIKTIETRTVEQPVQVVQTVSNMTQPVSYQANAIQQRAPLIEDQKYGQAEYNFYDGDVEDVHTEVEQSGGPASCGLLAGILALLSVLTLVGLMGVIFHRSASSCFSAVPLSHLIMACIAVVAAILGIWVCLSSRKAISNHLDLNHLLISIALILALLFFCYFLASSVYMYMYRPFHYSDLSGQKCGGNKQWGETFDDSTSFEDGWGTDRRILWWVAFFCIIAAIGFLILAICLWLLTKFPVQLARIILGCACLAAVILACFGITYFLQARTLFDNNFAMKNFKFSYLTTLMVLLAMGGVLLFLNAIWNLFKKRSGHFIFGTILIIYVFVFVCFLGLMLRSFRKTQFNNLQNASNGTCRDLISNFNQSCISKFCPNKYLSAGSSCTKEFLSVNWEKDNSLRYINPCCCNNVSSSFLCPLYYAAINCLLFLLAVIVGIGANYYLSDTSEYLEFSDKKFGLFELLFVIGIILCLIAFGFYWGFKPADSICAQNPNDPIINRDQFGNIVSYKDPNFVPVNLNKVYKGTVPPSAYLQGAVRYTDTTVPVSLASKTVNLQTANNIVTLNGNPAACGTNTNCGWRVGVLVINGKIANNYAGNIVGTSSARSLFFSDNNSNDDFILLKGNQNEVNNALAQLQVNVIDITKPTQVVVNGQQVDLITLSSAGLLAGENPTATILDSNGSVFNSFLGYQTQDLGSSDACFENNSCKSTLNCGTPNGGQATCYANWVFYSSNGLINMNIPIQAQNANGQWVPYNSNSLVSNSYFVHQNTQYSVLNPQISNGQLNFNLPRPLSGTVNLVLNLNDNSNQYLPYSKNIIIPADAQNPYTVETIQLLTKSGQGCIGAADVNACFANQQAKFANVDVTVVDPETGNRIAGVPVKLLSGIDGTRALASNTTDSTGIAHFNNVAYDYYTVQFEGSANYLPARALLAVQNNASGQFILNVHQRNSGNTILQQFVNNQNADQDFNLNVVSINGSSCNVTAYTKYCGYASHINDVENNKQGYENIQIHNFTVSNYLAYLQNNPASAATCGASDLSGTSYYNNGTTAGPRSLSFDWENVRKMQMSATSFQTLYCFNGWGLNTIRYFSNTFNTAPNADACDQFWPAGSAWSLSRLNQLNNA